MQNIIKKLKDKNLYFSLLITLVFFGIFVKMEFATDTYSLFAESVSSRVNHFLLSGRFITAFWWWIVNCLHFGNYLIYLTSYALACFCITLSIYNLFLVLNKKIKNEAICLLVSTVTIINPFTIELFLFLEKGVLTFAVLLSVLAFCKFAKYLDGDKKALKYVFIFMLIATFSYQGVIGLFIALSAVYIVFSTKSIKDFIKNNIIILLGYGIPAIINFLVIRLCFTNDRVNGAINFSESIQKVLSGTKEMIATYNILPKYTFTILICLIAIFIVATICINKKDKVSNKLLKILGLVYVFVAVLGITIVPQLMQNTASIWFVPRSTYPFGAIIGIMCIFLLYCTYSIYGVETKGNVNKSNAKIKNNITEKFTLKNIVYILIGIICVVLILLELYNFNKIEIDHYTLNYLDKTNSLKIGEEILTYEQETGNKVTKICIYKDMNESYTYKNLWASKDTNITGFYPEWSIVNMINYYNNLQLTTGEKVPEIEENFKQQDWDNFDKDQIIFIGDTIHYCKF